MKKFFKKSALVLGIMVCFTISYGQNDTLFMKTGEYLVGEVKELNTGIVVMETAYSDDDFTIEWDEVDYLRSSRVFIVGLSDGSKLDGSIVRDPDDSTKVIINDVDGPVSAPLLDVVYFKGVKESFLTRLSVLLAAGYSLTKANNLTQFSFRSNIGYLANTFSTDLYFNTIRNIQNVEGGQSSTIRTEGGANLNVFLIRDWYVLIASDLLQSDEQKIQLRANSKLGIGTYLVNNYKLFFRVTAGGAWNYEEFTSTDDRLRNSFEAFALTEFNIFNIGDLDFLVTAVAYPSVTEKGRFRSDISMNLKYELPLDFFFDIGFTFNYDNQPTQDASETDYIIQTTFGWDF
jgi:hypothetical protein